MRPRHHQRDIAEHRDELRPLGYHVAGIIGEQPDQLLAVAASGVAARQRPPSETILISRDECAEADIDRRHRAIRFLADDDVALLGAHDMHCLRAVGRDAERFADGNQPFPQFQSLISRHIDLVAQLA